MRKQLALLVVLGLMPALACTEGEDSAEEFCEILREPFPIARWVDVGQIVFVHPDASESEMLALVELVESDPNVAGVTIVDKDQAFEEFRELFVDQPEMIAQVSPESLPPSLRVRLHDDLEGLANPVDDHPLVFRVTDRELAGVDLPSIDQAVRPLTIRSDPARPAYALWSAGGSHPDLIEAAPEALSEEMDVLNEFWSLGQSSTNDEKVIAAARQVAAFYDTECG